MTKETKRDVEVSLVRSNQEHRTVSLRLRMETGQYITVSMSPYYFALMVTGMSDVPAEMSLRNVEVIVAPRNGVAQAVPEIDRKAIADKVYGKCCRIPGATFYNAAEFAIDEVEACRAASLREAE